MKTSNLNIFKVADYILANDQIKNSPITHNKLQKLLYYVKVWSLVAEMPLIPESFYKIKNGTVNKEIFAKYKEFGDSVPFSQKSDFSLKKEEKQLIDFIVENYIDLDNNTLSQLIQSELPWQQTAENEMIPEHLIKNYYSSLPFAKNFPLNVKKPFYPIISLMDYAFIFDFNQTDYKIENEIYYFKNYKEYQQQKEKIKKQFQAIFG